MLPLHGPPPLELLREESELVEGIKDAKGGGDADLELVGAEGGGLLRGRDGLERGGTGEEGGKKGKL